LLEMRAVAPGVVAIKGYLSGRYLCMERDGRLLGSVSPPAFTHPALG
ncbi:hypothetical protein chiPu_0023983, partial [Chiloscyllium punctatum]|nr:hypothetical protein [Chiloscyllium punctatum]